MTKMTQEEFNEYINGLEELVQSAYDLLRELQDDNELEEDHYRCECGKIYKAQGDTSESNQCWKCYYDQFKYKIKGKI